MIFLIITLLLSVALSLSAGPLLTLYNVAELSDQRSLVSSPLDHQIHILPSVLADIQTAKMASNLRVYWRLTLYGILFRSHGSNVLLGHSSTP